jgi:hypothetical protein
MSFRSSAAAALLLAATSLCLSACAGKPLTSVDRSLYRTAAVSSAVKMPPRYQYTDLTAQRARGAGGSFGLVGALVGEAVAAGSEGAGRKRFDPVVAASPVDVRRLVHENFVRTLEGSKLFTLTPANPDATFSLNVTSYGVAPVDDNRLGGAIAAQATMRDRAGKQIWSRSTVAFSDTSADLEQYEATPRLWNQVMGEAAQKLARQLVLYTDGERR